MDINYKTIGKRIAARRRSLGLKQAQVEEMAGIGYKYLSNIERGISIPSIEVIMRLSKALETTPDVFLIGTDKDDALGNINMVIKNLTPKQLIIANSFLNWLAQSGECDTKKLSRSDEDIQND